MRKFMLVTSVAVCVLGSPALAGHGTFGTRGETLGEASGPIAALAIATRDVSELQTLGGRDAILRQGPEMRIRLATFGGHGSHNLRDFLHDFLEDLIEKICERSGGQVVTPSTPGGLPGCIPKKKKKHGHHGHHGHNGHGYGDDD